MRKNAVFTQREPVLEKVKSAAVYFKEGATAASELQMLVLVCEMRVVICLLQADDGLLQLLHYFVLLHRGGGYRLSLLHLSVLLGDSSFHREQVLGLLSLCLHLFEARRGCRAALLHDLNCRFLLLECGIKRLELVAVDDLRACLQIQHF